MYVIAAKGLNIPLEENPKRYITDSAIVQVADSAYYTRRVTDADLVLASEAEYEAQEGAKQVVEQVSTKKSSKTAKAD